MEKVAFLFVRSMQKVFSSLKTVRKQNFSFSLFFSFVFLFPSISGHRFSGNLFLNLWILFFCYLISFWSFSFSDLFFFFFVFFFSFLFCFFFFVVFFFFFSFSILSSFIRPFFFYFVPTLRVFDSLLC